MEWLAKAHYALQDVGIVYILKTKDSSVVHRGDPITARNSKHQDVMYYLYVHKKDENRALHVVQEVLRSS